MPTTRCGVDEAVAATARLRRARQDGLTDRVPLRPEALAEDCAQAAIVVSARAR